MVDTDAALLYQLNTTAGCLFVGVTLTLCLYGCTCAQTLYYFHKYPRDRTYLKVLVVVVWLLDTGKVMAEIQEVWLDLVTRHGNPLALLELDLWLGVEQVFEDATQAVVELFFLQKVWHTALFQSQKLLFSILAGGLFLCEIVSNIWVENCLFTVTGSFNVQDEFNASTFSGTVCMALDILITAMLCYDLNLRRSEFSRTDNIVLRLIYYIMSRGIFLCFLQAVMLATNSGVDKYEGTFTSEIARPVLGTALANSLLVLLNERAHVREAVDRLMEPSCYSEPLDQIVFELHTVQRDI
ncbi:uncharacterized protein B0H18DRAFT_1215016 [Fomitopsis serialis]|uniref:uncharacterized protein n=1 Tax=Fomitopsis serialis TaxID=139415 RepID=UPI002007D7F6|nr:uncharacterized protein B0H18DRAFT_1215016 [Neoantrodia serialis]KAH9916635.1 hypothetical protein B0H18DRAFT_1215016 [Neoantrodia serialis]